MDQDLEEMLIWKPKIFYFIPETSARTKQQAEKQNVREKNSLNHETSIPM